MKKLISLQKSRAPYIVCIIACIILLFFSFLEKNFFLNKIKKEFTATNYYISRFYSHISEEITSLKFNRENVRKLRYDNNLLIANQVLLQNQLKKLELLEESHKSLKDVLNNIKKDAYKRIQLVKVIPDFLDPDNSRMFIDDGANNACKVGQALIDANGVIGRINKVYTDYSEVLLINDAESSIPVFSSSNVKGMLVGHGKYKPMTLNGVTSSDSMGINVGDKLYVLGIKNSYPDMYKIGVVTKIEEKQDADTLQPITIYVRPTSNLDKNMYAILLF